MVKTSATCSSMLIEVDMGSIVKLSTSDDLFGILLFAFTVDSCVIESGANFVTLMQNG